MELKKLAGLAEQRVKKRLKPEIIKKIFLFGKLLIIRIGFFDAQGTADFISDTIPVGMKFMVINKRGQKSMAMEGEFKEVKK